MTNITLPRATVEQALEALKYLHEEKCNYMRRNNLGDPLRENSARLALPAITALRAALAQQAEPAQEPVAWLVMDESGYVQHAASWRDAAHEHINDAINEHDLVCARTWRVVPAYTAPPQRKLVPLTEEEIKTAFHAARNAKLGASQDNSRHRLSVIEIARAVEKASWEKNHG